jgi:hypothetical protein
MAALPPDRRARNLAQSAREMRGAEKRVCILLILNDESVDIPPPRVFLKKRLQTVENKGRKLEGKSKEAASY